MVTTPEKPEPEATRAEQITERLFRATAVAVTGQPYGGQVRRTVLTTVIGVCLFLAPSVGEPVAVFGIIALSLLALEGKR